MHGQTQRNANMRMKTIFYIYYQFCISIFLQIRLTSKNKDRKFSQLLKIGSEMC